MRCLASKLALVPAVLTVGCPIFDPRDCGDVRDVCAPGYACDLRSGECLPLDGGNTSRTSCDSPDDCAGFETCAPTGECLAGSCAIHGCIDGYECEILNDLHTCSATDSGLSNVAADAASDPLDAG